LRRKKKAIVRLEARGNSRESRNRKTQQRKEKLFRRGKRRLGVARRSAFEHISQGGKPIDRKKQVWKTIKKKKRTC